MAFLPFLSLLLFRQARPGKAGRHDQPARPPASAWQPNFAGDLDLNFVSHDDRPAKALKKAPATFRRERKRERCPEAPGSQEAKVGSPVGPNRWVMGPEMEKWTLAQNPSGSPNGPSRLPYSFLPDADCFFSKMLPILPFTTVYGVENNRKAGQRATKEEGTTRTHPPLLPLPSVALVCSCQREVTH